MPLVVFLLMCCRALSKSVSDSPYIQVWQWCISFCAMCWEIWKEKCCRRVKVFLVLTLLYPSQTTIWLWGRNWKLIYLLLNYCRPINSKLMKQNRGFPPLSMRRCASGGIMSSYTATQPPTVGSQSMALQTAILLSFFQPMVHIHYHRGLDRT